jgi:hypothetical protein
VREGTAARVLGCDPPGPPPIATDVVVLDDVNEVNGSGFDAEDDAVTLLMRASK